MPTFEPGSRHQAIINVYNQSSVPISGAIDLWVGTLNYSKIYKVEAGKGTSALVLIDATMPATSGTFDVILQIGYNGYKMTYVSDDPVVIELMVPTVSVKWYVSVFRPADTVRFDVTVHNPNPETLKGMAIVYVGANSDRNSFWVEGNSSALASNIVVTMPDIPGIYELRVDLEWDVATAYIPLRRASYLIGTIEVKIPEPLITVAW